MHFSCGNYHNTLARSSLLLFLRDSARTAEDKEPFPHNRSPNLKHPPARLAENTNIAAEGFRASRACPRPSRPLASHAPLLSASHSFQRRCKLTCDTLMDRPNSNCPFKFRERPFQRWTSLPLHRAPTLLYAHSLKPQGARAEHPNFNYCTERGHFTRLRPRRAVLARCFVVGGWVVLPPAALFYCRRFPPSN